MDGPVFSEELEVRQVQNVFYSMFGMGSNSKSKSLESSTSDQLFFFISFGTKSRCKIALNEIPAVDDDPPGVGLQPEELPRGSAEG